MYVSLQHWVRAESRYTNSNDDFQILESTPTPQEGIILALPCLFRNRFLFFGFDPKHMHDSMELSTYNCHHLKYFCFAFVLDPLRCHKTITHFLRTEHLYLFGRNFPTVSVQLLSCQTENNDITTLYAYRP